MKVFPGAVEERNFEKKHISRQMEKYLETDVLERIKYDDGYRKKIDLLETFLMEFNQGGFVLDIGSNTAGEAELLTTKGFLIVATDINEIALSISQLRCAKYSRKSPLYYAADAHRLPFADNTFEAVTAFEVLHHLEKIEKVLGELYRVLKPGGHLFTYEPYSYNPYRRVAELRFYFLRSIERSFSKKGLTKLLSHAGFEIVSRVKHVLPPSEWKKRHASRLRAFLKDFYYIVSRQFLPVFGNLLFVAKKPSPASSEDHDARVVNISDRLVCPITGSRLKEEGNGFISTGEKKYFYRKYSNIPVLVTEDATPVKDSDE